MVLCKGYYECKWKRIRIMIIEHYGDFIFIIITQYKSKTYFLLLLNHQIFIIKIIEIFANYHYLCKTDCNYFAVSKNYYYVEMLEVVSYDCFTNANIHFIEFKFEKYDK